MNKWTQVAEAKDGVVRLTVDMQLETASVGLGSDGETLG